MERGLLQAALEKFRGSGNTIFPLEARLLSASLHDMSFKSPDGNRQSHSSHSLLDNWDLFMPGLSSKIFFIWFICSSPIAGLDVTLIWHPLALFVAYRIA
jgi:hypothetical protein